MKFRTFESAEGLLRVAEPALLGSEARSALLLGMALRLREGHSYGDGTPFFACLEGEGGIAAVAVQTPPHDLLLYVCPEVAAGTVGALAGHIARTGRTLPGVHGERPAASEFAETWAKETGTSIEISMEQRLYRLTEVVAPAAVPGALRAAEPGDRELLVGWVKQFVDEAVGGSPHSDPAAMVDGMTRASSLFVWDDRGPASTAGLSRPTPNGIAISLVYTPPERRGRGYAASCVASLSQRQLDGGRQFCTLFADSANATANALYRRIGFRPVADFAQMRFRTRDEVAAKSAA
jgi:predicted GNAT family acetyltransferase